MHGNRRNLRLPKYGWREACQRGGEAGACAVAEHRNPRCIDIEAIRFPCQPLKGGVAVLDGKLLSYAAGCIRTFAAFISRAGGSPNRRPYSRVN